MEASIIFFALAATINKTVSTIKSIGKDTNQVITQLVVWVVGLLALMLAAKAQITSQYALPGFEVPLEDLDSASIIMLAWMLGSSGSFIYDIKKAIDNTDSSSEPKLLN